MSVYDFGRWMPDSYAMLMRPGEAETLGMATTSQVLCRSVCMRKGLARPWAFQCYLITILRTRYVKL